MTFVSELGGRVFESVTAVEHAVRHMPTNQSSAIASLQRADELQASIRAMPRREVADHLRELRASKRHTVANFDFNSKLPENFTTLSEPERDAIIRKIKYQVALPYEQEEKAINQIIGQGRHTQVFDRQSAHPFYRFYESIPKRILLPLRFYSDMDTNYVNAGSPPRVFDTALMTAVTFMSEGEVLPEDRAIIIMLHGAGAMHSSSNAMIPLMGDLARLEINGERKRQFATICIDSPMHAFGTRDENMDQLDHYMDYLHNLVERYAIYNKPIFIFGRSFGANASFEYAHRYDNIAGAIHMSGLHPEWIEENVFNMRANGFHINEEGLALATKLLKQMTYIQDAQPLKASGLVLQGLKDIEYDPEKQKSFWIPVLQPLLGCDVHLYEDGEHNLLNPFFKHVHKAARQATHDFILSRIS